MKNLIQLLKRRNIGLNVEIHFTYLNLALLLFFPCNLGPQVIVILYGFEDRCLFGVAFLNNAKLGRLLCAVSTHKSLPHQRIAQLFATKAPDP